MSSAETEVRTAAAALHRAIIEAKASGLTVDWPRSADGLLGIAVSATGKAAPVTAHAPASRRKAKRSAPDAE